MCAMEVNLNSFNRIDSRSRFNHANNHRDTPMVNTTNTTSSTINMDGGLMFKSSSDYIGDKTGRRAPPRGMSASDVRRRRLKFPLCLIFMQALIIVLYGLFVDYPDDANTRIFAAIDRQRIAALIERTAAAANGTATTDSPGTAAGAGAGASAAVPIPSDEELSKMYPNQDTITLYGAAFQDSQFFLITGLTLLFIGLRPTGLSTMTQSFMIFTLCLEWSFLLYGLVRLDGYAKPNPRVFVLAVYFAEASMIAYGFILGRCNATQLLVMSVLEMAVCVANDYLCADTLKVNDPGGVLTYNLFGTYFGISVQKMLYKKGHSKHEYKKTYSMISEILSFVGSSILWVFWPTAMGSIFVDGHRHRTLLNTYYALIGSAIAAIAFSPLLNLDGKFTASQIQNAALAGGVTMSGSADSMMGCYAALIVGCCAGMVSVFTYTYIQPFFAKTFRILDTCGSHGLHGTPAILGSVTSMVVAYLATEEVYGASLYMMYPARAPRNNTVDYDRVHVLWPDIPPGENRSSSGQALYHLAALAITFSVSSLSGLVVGFIIKQDIFDPVEEEDFYDDTYFWHMPSEDAPQEHEGFGNESSHPPTQASSRADLVSPDANTVRRKEFGSMRLVFKPGHVNFTDNNFYMNHRNQDTYY